MNKEELTNEQKETYERDRENHIKYINEQYKEHKLELVKKEDLRKQKVKTILKSVISSIIILIGILALAGVLLYGTYEDKFSPNVFCGNTTIENNVNYDTPCPTIPKCPACSNVCELDFPDEIEVTIKNETDN